MKSTNTFLGLVVARGGSKGIPRKNLMMVAGHPLVAWPILAGNHSKKLSRLVLSTDDAEIAAIGKQYGCEVPFLRPARLAEDTTIVIDVMRHALETLYPAQNYPEYLLLLQPTSPQVTAEDIDHCIDLANQKNPDTVITVYRHPSIHPYSMYSKDDAGFLTPYTGKMPMMRRQDLDPVYFRTGLVYIAKTQLILEKNTIYGSTIIPYEVAPQRSLCIDTLEELAEANRILMPAH